MRTISPDGLGVIYGVAAVGNDKVAVAADEGLVLINLEGSVSFFCNIILIHGYLIIFFPLHMALILCRACIFNSINTIDIR